jgi:hypothetical protein
MSAGRFILPDTAKPGVANDGAGMWAAPAPRFFRTLLLICP